MTGLASLLALLALLLSPLAARAEGTLQAPASAAAGGTLEVRWTGAAPAPTDFISIDKPGAPDPTYGPYAYPAQSNPVSLQVPEEPGDYVLRYHSGAAGYAVQATAPLQVTAVSATLSAPASVDIGGLLQVTWTGPANPTDFISIDKVGADERTYGPYAYPKSAGSPLSIKVPDEPGDYAVRYHLGQSYRVIASVPLRVGAIAATLAAKPNVPAGSAVSVTWTGPSNAGDFVSIDAVGAPDRTYGNYAYPDAAKQEPVVVRAPDEPGEYLLRYHLASSYTVIGSAPLRVDAVTATLSAPAEVPAGKVFEVRWEGPDNEADFITLVAPTLPEKKWGPSNGYTRRGNPARLEAPREPGEYELRYLAGQSNGTLGKTRVRVTPSPTPSTLRVLTDAKSAGAPSAVELVLDASGSMLQKLGTARRIEIAKNALIELTRDALPDGTAFALRVFGHKEAGSCRTDLELPLAPIDRKAAIARIQSLGAMNLAKTPIGASLLKVKDDLAGVTGPALVVLVTDGEETCDGNPKAAIETLRKAGLDVRVDIVGFAVDEVVLKETFRDWARLGGGNFFDAQDAKQLAAAIRATLRPTFEVLAADKVVASGVVNGDAVELPAGSYRVRVGAKDLGEVALEAGTPRDLRY